MKPEIKNIESKILSDHWYTLNRVSFDYLRQDGTWVHQVRESYDRGNGATVLLYNRKKQTVLLIRQFRMPSYLNGNQDGIMIETCAGLLDGQDPEQCVINEIEEEVGYRIEKVQKVFESYMSPGAVTEIIHFFIAEYEDDQKVSSGGGLETEQEEIEVLEIPFEEAYTMIASGEIRDAKTIMLLQYAKAHNLLSK